MRLFNVFSIATSAGQLAPLVVILEKETAEDAYAHAVNYYGEKHGQLFVKAVRCNRYDEARAYIADRKRRKKG